MVLGFCPLVTPTSGEFRLNKFLKFSLVCLRLKVLTKRVLIKTPRVYEKLNDYGKKYFDWCLCVFPLFNRDHYLRWISGRTEIYKVKVNEVNIQDIGSESFISFEDD